MKIALGPLKISFRDDGKKPSLDEVGAIGTSIFGGQLVEEEYNTDLRGDKALIVYDKMRRSDGQVKAVLLVCELPFRAAKWEVRPASEDSKDIEVADFISENLFDGMTITWDSFLHHILLMLPFGFSVFEKVYEIVDGQVKWRKFAPRLPKTLYKWKLDETGGLAGITQFVMRNERYEFIDIPVEKILVFTHEKEGSNFEGISLLRAAYKHWYYKDHLYRIDAVASERHATGIPSFTHPAEISSEEKGRIDDIGEHLYANEKMYIRLADGYGFDIKGLSGSVKDLNPSIQHHDRMIAQSILASFMSLGSGDVGSFALARDQSSFFLMSLRSVGMNICDTLNRYAIPQLVDYNFEVDAYPKLVVSGLETRAMAEYAKAIVDLATVGALTIDEGLQKTLRGMLGLPEVQEAKREREALELSSGASDKKRALTYGETFVAFGEIEKKLDDAQVKFLEQTKEIQARQIENLVDVAMKAIEDKNFDKIDTLEPRYRTEMSGAMYQVLIDMYKYGRRQVRLELSAQKHTSFQEPLDPADDVLVQQFIRTRTKANAQLLASKLKQAVMFTALSQIKRGIADKKELAEALKLLSDRELVAAASFSVSEAFNYGRSAEAEKFKDDVASVQYSAIMDEGTCSVCRPLDGQEWPMDSIEVEKYAGGNAECLGAGRCRCILVYISKRERRGI